MMFSWDLMILQTASDYLCSRPFITRITLIAIVASALQLQMEEEEHTDRKQQLAMLYQKLNKIKKYLNEGMCIKMLL